MALRYHNATMTPNPYSQRTTASLVADWNDSDGSLSYLVNIEEELKRRGYTTRSTDPTDDLPRLAEGSERLYLTYS